MHSRKRPRVSDTSGATPRRNARRRRARPASQPEGRRAIPRTSIGIAVTHPRWRPVSSAGANIANPGPEIFTEIPVNLHQFHGCALHLDEGDRHARTRTVGFNQDFLIPQCGLDVVDLEGHVRRVGEISGLFGLGWGSENRATIRGRWCPAPRPRFPAGARHRTFRRFRTCPCQFVEIQTRFGGDKNITAQSASQFPSATSRPDMR